MYNDIVSCIAACVVALIGNTSNHHKLLYLSQLSMVSLHDTLLYLSFNLSVRYIRILETVRNVSYELCETYL